MKLEPLLPIKGVRQDGAVCNGYLFSFNHKGECTVYKTNSLFNTDGGKADVFAEFTLDKNELISPHSNSVMFGNEYYDKNDEFPLLYTNIYNNYSDKQNKLKGVTLVYRIRRKDSFFETTLVQMIEIGFTGNENLWKSPGETEDIRPYGNFVIDRENSRYYAFTMRDYNHTTRYFSFSLPKASAGEFSMEYGVNKITLSEDDIIDYFDCDYHHFVQGACFANGKIYSLEGFTDSEDNPPAIRIIDVKAKKQILYKKFSELGTKIEPEMIDFDNETCYTTDHNGNVSNLIFE